MKILARKVLNPLLSKFGTYVAGWLSAVGATADEANQIVLGLSALVFVLADLAIDEVKARRGTR